MKSFVVVCDTSAINRLCSRVAFFDGTKVRQENSAGKNKKGVLLKPNHMQYYHKKSMSCFKQLIVNYLKQGILLLSPTKTCYLLKKAFGNNYYFL